jgi:hypothetical protein
MKARDFFKTSPMFDSVEIVRARPTVTIDLDEGRYADLACRACWGSSAVYDIADHQPAYAYIATLRCKECGAQLVEFNAFTMEAV